jgi:hypothetical protein
VGTFFILLRIQNPVIVEPLLAFYTQITPIDPFLLSLSLSKTPDTSKFTTLEYPTGTHLL